LHASQHFLLLASAANLGKAVALAAFVATAPAFQQALCVGGNLADLTAKTQVSSVCFVVELKRLPIECKGMIACDWDLFHGSRVWRACTEDSKLLYLAIHPCVGVGGRIALVCGVALHGACAFASRVETGGDPKSMAQNIAVVVWLVLDHTVGHGWSSEARVDLAGVHFSYLFYFSKMQAQHMLVDMLSLAVSVTAMYAAKNMKVTCCSAATFLACDTTWQRWLTTWQIMLRSLQRPDAQTAAMRYLVAFCKVPLPASSGKSRRSVVVRCRLLCTLPQCLGALH
jgi:hypothetical protein